uniref:SAP domain-containing protein n=1 Tax=Glossina brevipalpis TaxID=37001 RepID=A0A1A9WH26_9MUSC
MPALDVNVMKVADLKRELKLRGLSISGNKTELQERLQAVIESDPLLEDSAISGEDLLDEDAVLSDENDLLQSPSTALPTLLPNSSINNKDVNVAEDDLLESPSCPNFKKIVLKRKNSITTSPTTESTETKIPTIITSKENSEHSLNKMMKMSERNPITTISGNNTKNNCNKIIKKVGELTMQERLELRAKKFGLSVPSTTEDIATSKGVELKGTKRMTTTANKPLMVNDEKQLELLKKRAERFGCVISTNLAKVDAQEKLLKRKERFGGESIITDTKAKMTISMNNITKDEWAERARKRMERFKTNSSNNSNNITVTVVTASTTATAASN